MLIVDTQHRSRACDRNQLIAIEEILVVHWRTASSRPLTPDGGRTRGCQQRPPCTRDGGRGDYGEGGGLQGLSHRSARQRSFVEQALPRYVL